MSNTTSNYRRAHVASVRSLSAEDLCKVLSGAARGSKAYTAAVRELARRQSLKRRDAADVFGH